MCWQIEIPIIKMIQMKENNQQYERNSTGKEIKIK